MPLGDVVDRLAIANIRIALLESAIRNGTRLSDAEIGRRTRIIRELNRERVAMKNALNAFDPYAFREIKVHHASE